MSDAEEARRLFEAGDFAAAEPLFRRAAAGGGDAAAHYNLGVALGRLGRFEEAAGCYRRALEINPAFIDAYINIGAALNELGLVAQARQAFALARKIAPDNAVAALDEGIAALALGDYENGWKGFAARWQLPAYAKFRRVFPQPQWRGENLAGKALFLYAEQGFGDSIQMARYVPLLAAAGASVILETPPALQSLFAGLPARIVAKGDALPDFDYHAALMDVPQYYGTRLENIPNAVPYLRAEPRAASASKKRVGLCWAGRASHENDASRSLPFARLAPLFAHADIEFVSLQKLVPPRDETAFSQSGIIGWGRGFADFGDAARAIAACDLVISVDTAIAHLAGALGRPLWVMLPFYPDWRWLLGRKDSPWYPTARLWRQGKRGDWETVVAEIAAALDKL